VKFFIVYFCPLNQLSANQQNILWNITAVPWCFY